MQFLGTIAAVPDTPGIDLENWVELIATHPSLLRFPHHEGLDPFTKAPTIYRVAPGGARVVVGGAEVGQMVWAEDGSGRIGVLGDPAIVEPIAREVASKLGGIYRACE